ncbi:uncharacterized protein [Maniola hyperantus]
MDFCLSTGCVRLARTKKTSPSARSARNRVTLLRADPLFALITVFLVLVMVSSSPLDHRPDIVSPIEYYAAPPRPTPPRPTPRPPSPLAGGWSDVKGYPSPPPVTVYPSVRKGEYVCGNKICKLTPGVVPKGCNGICQYPIH